MISIVLEYAEDLKIVLNDMYFFLETFSAMRYDHSSLCACC